MINPQELHATAKHFPENLDPNDVRYAARILETYQTMLHGLTKFEIDAETGRGVLTFDVSRDTLMDVLSHCVDTL